MIIKTNKDNWTGQKVGTEVKNAGGNVFKFRLYGYDFKATFQTDKIDNTKIVILEGGQWDKPLMQGFRFGGVWDVQGMHVNRQHKNPFKAIIKVLSNIL